MIWTLFPWKMSKVSPAHALVFKHSLPPLGAEGALSLEGPPTHGLMLPLPSQELPANQKSWRFLQGYSDT